MTSTNRWYQPANKSNRPMTKVWWRTLGFALLAVILTTSTTSAQPFSSGSTGADGALDFPGAAPGTVIDFDPAALNPPRDTDGDGVYHFMTINIPANVTLRFRANKAGAAPIHWLATGTVVIDGILDLNGENGHDGSPSAPRLPSVPGPGGFAGGIGANAPNIAAQAGFGPGGGIAGGCSASHAVSLFCFKPAYGNAFLLPLIGGSGGGGGSTQSSRGGGAGGGALLIASSVSINVSGTIRANGGNGTPFCCDSGSGSGGAIRLVAPTLTGNGTLSAQGGGGGGAGNVPASVGRIRLEATQNTFTGTMTGDARAVTLLPSTILLPTSPQPNLRVTSIGGQAVPANPRGSFSPVDVTIDTAQAVTIELKGENIPTGTTVNLTIVNETEGSQVITSSPLTGTAALSTASANVTIPAGFSRIFTRATW